MRDRRYSRPFAVVVICWICIIFFIAFRIDTDHRDANEPFRHFKYPDKLKSVSVVHHYPQLKVKGYENWTNQMNALEHPQTYISDQEVFGELGKAVNIDANTLSDEQKKLYDLGWKNNAFNEYASNLISLRRNLPDLRDPRCLALHSSGDIYLPDVSVIIIFHQEAWSTLLRTVHSVIDRTPKHLLREVILVDDNSNMTHLLQQLDRYIEDNFKRDLVKLIRSKERIGLIRARIKGAIAAVGQVIIFLDSHCEATTGWVEPLLRPIAENNRSAVVPIIEAIKADTLEIVGTQVKNVQIGAFDWGLIFRWFPLSAKRTKEHLNDLAPLESPTMAGGLFAIDRQWFRELGMYDSGFRIWGGENLELSFKVWMCGGRLVTALCSHVGHIFRSKSPYNWGPEKNVLSNNLIRLAMVWLDDYKEFYLERVPKKLKTPSFYGDISEQVRLREGLRCKDFGWYHKHVFPEMFVPTEAVYAGAIENMEVNYCVDSVAQTSNDNVTGFMCHGQKGNQLWFYTKDQNIRRDIMCISSNPATSKSSRRIQVSRCPLDAGVSKNHLWIYTENQLRHGLTNSCLELMPNNVDLILNVCDDTNIRQRWQWKTT